MNRHYTTEEYRHIVQALRRTFDNCAVTTDIMVGFAGETEEEFQDSLAFAKEIAFAKVHVFAYSRRPGTKAYLAPNQCTNRVKEARSREMIAVTKTTQADFFQAQLGRVEEVLFEQERKKNVYEGYTRNYTPVLAVSSRPLHGLLLPVRLTGVLESACTGEIVQN